MSNSIINPFAFPPPVNITLTDSDDHVGIGIGAATTATLTAAALGAVADDRKIIVTCGGSRNIVAQGLITGVTVGGNSMTEVITQANGDARGDTGIFIIDAGAGSALAATTSADVVITFDSACFMYGAGVYRMTGAPSLTAEATNQDTTGSPYSATLDIPANGAAVGHVNVNSSGLAGWTNLVEDFDFAAPGSGAHDEFATEQSALAISVTGPAGNGGLCVASWGPATF